MDTEEVLSLVALIIYFLYPVLARRRKKRQQRQPEPIEAPAPLPPEPLPVPQAPKARSVDELFQETRRRAVSLRDRAAALLNRVQSDERTVRLVEPVRRDALARTQDFLARLNDSMSLSTLMQDSQILGELSELLDYLEQMANQRLHGEVDYLGDADRLADACYAPLLGFARANDIPLRTLQPIAVRSDWDMSIVLNLASSSVAPLRVPVGLARTVWLWPGIAHEVAQDFYFSVEDLEVDLHRRLGLHLQAHIPSHAQDVNEHFLRQMFGPWLQKTFADVLATWMLGPAYVKAMRRAYARPGDPPQAAAIIHDGSMVDGQPPAHLRVYMACRVLHHLGFHREADDQWAAWKRAHQGQDVIYLPVGTAWSTVPETAFTEHADDLLNVMLEDSWPELAGARLISIPGLPYLHAEHAKALRLEEELLAGQVVRADPRLVIAAAVSAAAKQPSQHDRILEAARRSIIGVGTREAIHRARDLPTMRIDIPTLLTQSFRDRNAVREAIILGAAFAPRHHR